MVDHSTMADHQKLIELVQPQLQGDETVEAITKRLLGAAMVLGQQLDDKTVSKQLNAPLRI